MKVCCDRCEKIMDLSKYSCNSGCFEITIGKFDEKLYLCTECHSEFWKFLKGEQIEENNN